MHKVHRCALCGGDRFFDLYTKTIQNERPWSAFLRTQDLPAQLSARVCKACGWIFQSPMYDDDELHRLYNLESEPASAEAVAMGEVNAHRRAQDVFAELRPWLGSSLRAILDVGGRNGELMGPFVERGHDVSVLDMDGGQPLSAGVKKIRKPFLALEGCRFGVVTMLHVLEHVESPLAFLTHAHDLLEPDGLLYIEVPSELLTPLMLRHVGDHRHIVYFSRATLRSTLEAADFDCLLCQLKVGFVGSRLPVIRAVARKAARQPQAWRPGRWALVRSLAEVLHPVPMIVRALNLIQR